MDDGYIVTVEWSSDVIYYWMSDGQKTDFFFGGAIAVTYCELNGVEIDPPSSDSNCWPDFPF